MFDSISKNYMQINECGISTYTNHAFMPLEEFFKEK